MSPSIIRRVEGEELVETFFSLSEYGFEPTPPFTSPEERRQYLPGLVEDTIFILFEDGQAMASAASVPLTQNVRGKIYPSGGIWEVVTYPERRRQGYSHRILSQLLAAIRAEGMIFSALYPFRASFYERLGYVSFPYGRRVSFSPLALTSLFDWDLGGQVERLLIADGLATFRDYVRRCQSTLHGLAVFPDQHAQFEQGIPNRYWVALARYAGEIVGAMLYRITDFKGSLEVSRFHYSHQRGKYILLEWLARHADQVSEVAMAMPPFEQPETWLADLNPQTTTPSSAHNAMGRVLDVARIGGMATGPGRFSAKITDSFCPWNTGNYTFETVGGVLQVSESQTADCELTIQALSALVYGTHEISNWVFRGWGNPTPELQACLRTMFPPLQPYLGEWF